MSDSNIYERLTSANVVYGSGGGPETWTEAETLRLTQLDMNYELLSSAYPELVNDPDALYELASSTDPITANHMGAELFGITQLEAIANRWNGYDEAQRRATWNDLDERQRGALLEYGIKPPEIKNDDDPFLKDVMDVAGGVFGFAMGGVAKLASYVPGAEYSLDLLGKIDDLPERLYRTIRQTDDTSQVIALLSGLAGGAAVVGLSAVAAPFTMGTSVAAGLTLGGALVGAGVGAYAVNGTEFAELWNESGNGEAVFLDGAKERARQLVNDRSTLAIASDIAYNTNPYDLVVNIASIPGTMEGIVSALDNVAMQYAEPGTAEYQQIRQGLDKLMATDTFREAVKTLQNGKISYGRDLGRLLGLDPSSNTYHAVSGSVDGFMQVVLDPFLLASPFAKAYRFRQYSIADARGTPFRYKNKNGVERVVTDAVDKRIALTQKAGRVGERVSAMDTQIARSVELQDPNMMPKDYRGIYDELTEFRNERKLADADYEFTMDEFHVWMKESENFKQLVSGIGTVKGIYGTIAIRPDADVFLVNKFKKKAREVINVLVDPDAAAKLERKLVDADADQVLRPPTRGDQPIHGGFVSTDVVGPSSSRVIRPTSSLKTWRPNRVGVRFGRFLDQISNMAPRGGVVHLTGARAAEDVTRTVNGLLSATNIPSKYKQEWIRAIMNEGTVAGRARLIFSLYDTIFTVTGLKDVGRGRELFAEFIEKHNQQFAPTALDKMNVGGVSVGRGVLASHQAVAMAVPDMREMIKAVRYNNIYGDMVNAIQGDRYIDTAINKFWKPSVILRIGFIPRAGGEELLASLMRGMDGQLGQEFAARRLRQRDLYESMRADIDQRLQAKMPLTEAQQIAYDKRNAVFFRPLERLASRLPFAGDPINSFIDAYEKMLRRLIDPRIASQSATRRNLAQLVNRRSDFVQALIAGKHGSWRRMGLQGINADLFAASNRWTRRHAETIMREVGTGSQSQLQEVRESADRILERKTWHENKNLSVATSPDQRQIIGRGEGQYNTNVFERVDEIVDDLLTGDAVISVLPGIKDASIVIDDQVLGELLRNFESLPYYQQEMLLNLLVARPSMLENLADNLVGAGIDAQLADVLRGIFDGDNLPIAELQTAISQFATTTKAGQALLEPKNIAILNGALDVISGLDKNTRRWLQVQLATLRDNPVAYKQLIGLDTGKVPTFVTLREQSDQQIRDRILTALRENEELADIMTRSQRTDQLADGRQAVNVKPSSADRWYSPHLNGLKNVHNEIELLLQQGYTVDDILVELSVRYANNPATTAPWSAHVASLPVAAREQAIRLTLENVLAERLDYLEYAPAGAIGYLDPRVAQWVSETLSDTVDADPYKLLHYYDAPRTALASNGATFRDAEAIRESGIDAVRHNGRTRNELNPVRGKVDPDNPTFGTPQEEVFEELADKALAYINYHFTSNSGVRYNLVPDQEPLLQYVDGQFVPISKTSFGAEEIVYDSQRRAVNFKDRTDLFTEEVVVGTNYNWGLVGPKIVDKLNERAGRTRYKQTRTYRDAPNERVEFVDNIPLTYSSLDDAALDAGPQYIVARIERIDQNSMFDKIINFGFDKVITPAVDAIARSPMAFHAFNELRVTSQRAMSGFLDETAVNDVNQYVRTGPAARAQIDQHVGLAFRDQAGKVTVAGDAMGIYEIIVDRTWNNAAIDSATIMSYLRDLDLKQFQNAFGDIVTVNNLDELNEFLNGLQKIDAWSFDVDEIASRSAINSMEPFLDTADSRSMFSLYYKNMLPFWYAEENFLKRWLRGAMTSGTFGLDQVRKLQLGYSGLRTAGIIRTDENGTDWFVYPGSGILPNLLGAVTPLSTENVGTMFASTTTSMLPGFNAEAGRPGVGPVAQLPLRFASFMFPEYFRETERAIVGDIGTSQSVYNMLVPASLRRVADAMTANENSAKFVAAMDAAMIMLQAEEKTRLPNNATPEQREDFLQRARNHARIIMFSGAITGFISMGAPAAITTGTEFKDNPFAWLTGIGISDPAKTLNKRYRSYISAYGYEEGIDKFLADYPDSTLDDIVNPLAFTTSRTEALGGRGLPATEAGLQWSRENREWIGQYTYASPWFAPIPTGVEDFSRFAYQEGFNLGVKATRPPREVMNSLIVQRSSGEYFRQIDIFDQRIRNAPEGERQRLRADKELFKSQFYAANPIFADHLASTDNARQRETTIDQMRQALRDPNTPRGEAYDAFSMLINKLDEYLARKAAVGFGQGVADRRTREQLKNYFLDWGQAWAEVHEPYATFWSTVVKLTV